MDARVLKLQTIADCESFRKNALERGLIELAAEARERKVQLKADTYNTSNEVERECIEALYAYEELLTDLRGKTQKASRTWPMIAKYGIIETVERVVNRPADAIAYTALVDMGLKEYAFEAVILRHPDYFSEQAIERSTKRMSDQSESIENEEGSGWTYKELEASVHAYLEMQIKDRLGQTFVKASYYAALAQEHGRTASSFERRMQNISYVLSLMGRTWLTGLKPAKNVGINIAVEIEKLINESLEFTALPVVAFQMAVSEIAKKPQLIAPAGNATPRITTNEVKRYERDKSVIAWVLHRANGVCECCNKPGPFVRTDGTLFLEVHHVHQMADKGPDTIDNAVALCPNCHREIHYGVNATQLVANLYKQVSSLQSNFFNRTP